MSEAKLPPVIKQVMVRATPERAFARFTAEMGTWWPLGSHSVFEGEANEVRFDGRVGGHIVERTPDGRESCWGTVTAWDPPRRVAFTWHPGRDPASAQDVEVAFAPEGERTRVTLTHTGWERMGADAKKARGMYAPGWQYVLGAYNREQSLFMWTMNALIALVLMFRRKKPAMRQA